jgi:hypothetical protein
MQTELGGGTICNPELDLLYLSGGLPSEPDHPMLYVYYPNGFGPFKTCQSTVIANLGSGYVAVRLFNPMVLPNLGAFTGGYSFFGSVTVPYGGGTADYLTVDGCVAYYYTYATTAQKAYDAFNEGLVANNMKALRVTTVSGQHFVTQAQGNLVNCEVPGDCSPYTWSHCGNAAGVDCPAGSQTCLDCCANEVAFPPPPPPPPADDDDDGGSSCVFAGQPCSQMSDCCDPGVFDCISNICMITMGRRLSGVANNYAWTAPAACGVDSMAHITYRVDVPMSGFREERLARVRFAIANAMEQFAAVTGANALCAAGDDGFTMANVLEAES